MTAVAPRATVCWPHLFGKARRADTKTTSQMRRPWREPLDCRPVGPLGAEWGTREPGDCVAPASIVSAHPGLKNHCRPIRA
jgi:hypothetical protein